MNMITSFTPILMTLSSKSDSGTFDLFRYDIVDMDDIGLTHKLSVTTYINGPLANVYFSVGDLGSTNLYGIYSSKSMAQISL
jgi:hypothetical protein